MKAKWIGIVLVGAAVAGIVVYKGIARGTTSPAAIGDSSAAPAVVLVADPEEAGSACGCGLIIHAVRSAGEKGVAVREVEPGSKEARAYRAMVSPTVLFLDAKGGVEARYEGEGMSTIETIEGRLDSLARARS